MTAVYRKKPYGSWQNYNLFKSELWPEDFFYPFAMEQMRVLVLDCETTGLDPATDRVVEIGWHLVDRGEIVSDGSELVNPGIPIPEDATKIHGITDDMVAGKRSLPEALEDLPTCIDRVAAFNAAYDASVLGEWARGQRWWCLLHASAAYLPKQTNYKLDTIGGLFGLPPEGLHRSPPGVGPCNKGDARHSQVRPCAVATSSTREAEEKAPRSQKSQAVTPRNPFLWAPPKKRGGQRRLYAGRTSDEWAGMLGIKRNTFLTRWKKWGGDTLAISTNKTKHTRLCGARGVPLAYLCKQAGINKNTYYSRRHQAKRSGYPLPCVDDLLYPARSPYHRKQRK